MVGGRRQQAPTVPQGSPGACMQVVAPHIATSMQQLACNAHPSLPCSEAGLEGWKPPESVQVHGSFAGYWRGVKGLSSRGRAANELALLHVPQEGVAALKAMAAGEGVRWRGMTISCVWGRCCKD